MDIRYAKEDEIAILTAISKAAFDSDIQVGSTEPGGPAMYDNEDWHREMMDQKFLFSLYEHNELVGGMLFTLNRDDQTVLDLWRIFIAPEHMRKGYGLAAMKAVETIAPIAKTIRLDTPAWNIRTNAFYPKCGYREIARDEEMVYYEKQL